MDSTHGWREGAADPWPWLGYFTNVIAGAYAVFADRAAAALTPGTTQQRVREHIVRAGWTPSWQGASRANSAFGG